MPIPRTKSYLFLALKQWATNLKPHDLHLSKDFNIEVQNISTSSLMLRIKDPGYSGPHYYEVKITEKM